MSAPSDDALAVAAQWLEQGRRLALATVVSTWGSSPYPAGSQMVIDHEGRFAGAVSGGCVEGAVVAAARAAIADARPRLLAFGVSDAQAFEVGLSCGGRIRVQIDPVAHGALEPEMFRALTHARADNRPAVLVLALAGEDETAPVAGGDERPWYRLLTGSPEDLGPAGEIEPEVRAVALAGLTSGVSRLLEGERALFVQVYPRPIRLVVVGAVQVAQALCRLAATLDWHSTVVDPRGAFATGERFPEVERIVDWPQVAMARLGLDERTAVVALTHDPKVDEPALVAALSSPAFYVGALGSRRTHEARVGRLREAGLAPEAIDRIRAPIGLDIGALSPAEIAVSIAAEIVAALRGGDHPR